MANLILYNSFVQTLHVIGKLIIAVNNFNYRFKWLFFSTITAFVVVLTLGLTRIAPQEEITHVLPKTKDFKALRESFLKSSIQKKVFFSIQTSQDDPEIDSLLEILTNDLKTITKNNLFDLKSDQPDIQALAYNYYYNNFPTLCDSNYYQRIEQKTNSDTIKQSLTNVQKNLVSQSGILLKTFLINDPLFLTTPYLQELELLHTNENFIIEENKLYSKNYDHVFFNATLISDENKNHETLNTALTLFKTEWNKKHPDHSFDYFGTFQVAVSNASQIKKDTILTLIISLTLILGILIFYYKKLYIPFLFILPGAFGGLFTLGLVGYFHPNISGLSVAASAVLLGIVIDYSFHFFTHLRHSKSINETISDIASPMLTSSFTTILAFYILTFSQSIVLIDFGILAALCLLGTLLFTLFILPVLLRAIAIDFALLPAPPSLFKLPKITPKMYPIVLGGIAIITIVLFYHSKNIQFDGELSNLSYHTSDLVEKEIQYSNINPQKEQKIFLIASGNTTEEAISSNYKVAQTLKKLQLIGDIKSYNSTSDFLIPTALKQQRAKQWNVFWEQKKDSTLASFNTHGSALGFNTAAFQRFNNWISTPYQPTTYSDDIELLQELGLTPLITERENTIEITSTFVVDKKQKTTALATLATIPGVSIIDRTQIATTLVELIKDDFNYLLYFSAGIVFITLLVIYGRIELTLLAFIPMVVSWIWILGLAALLGIPFNFVNIIITTIIFGLGDDFSVFVTDGLISEHRNGKKILGSYQTAITLSALTTIVGTGVLIFAKHPALYSISIISVLGISCILIISFVLQPILFNIFVFNRTKRHLPPATLSSIIFSSITFSLFAAGSIFISFILIIFTLPIKKNRKQNWINILLSTMARLDLNVCLHIKKTWIDTDKIDFKKPSIIIANHTSFSDILLLIALNPKVVLVVKDWVYKSPIFGFIIKKAGYIYAGNGPEDNLRQARELIAKGYSIAIFPEGTRSETGELGRFHKGAFLLAEELKLDITPIILHGGNDSVPKSDLIMHKGEITAKALAPIRYSDKSWGETYSERTKSISKHFKAAYADFRSTKETADYLAPQILKNYIYKSPFIEWYVKVKWILEKENFENFNKLIGNRKTITDLGCGYGYLSLYLALKDQKRKITAIDYDEEKIEITKHLHSNKNQIQFEAHDLRSYTIEPTDVIILMDVLHYLSEENQLILLNKCILQLNANGILLLRDGLSNNIKAHKKRSLRKLFLQKF